MSDYSSIFLWQIVTVTVDRPIWSKHPNWWYNYPVNYWYITGVMAPDNEELDAYILGVDSPVEVFTGRCVAIIERIEDNDDKLIIVPDWIIFTVEKIRELTFFQEQFFDSKIILA